MGTNLGNQSAYPTGDHGNVQPEYGFSKREYIAIEMQKALIIGIYSNTKKGDDINWPEELIAEQAMYHTDAIINALNENGEVADGNP